jgi:hypothetical protein
VLATAAGDLPRVTADLKALSYKLFGAHAYGFGHGRELSRLRLTRSARGLQVSPVGAALGSSLTESSSLFAGRFEVRYASRNIL